MKKEKKQTKKKTRVPSSEFVSYSLNFVRWVNYADFPLSLQLSAWASPESRCQAEETVGIQGPRRDLTERQTELDTKEMLWSQK